MVYDKLLMHLGEIVEYLTEGSYKKITGKLIRRIFVESNRIYVGDFVVYAALTSSD
jgi:hypothetical protein